MTIRSDARRSTNEVLAELVDQAAYNVVTAQDVKRGFCGYCGASIPHRAGEGRCDRCMRHLPSDDPYFSAKFLSDSVAPQLMSDLARKHGKLICENQNCAVYKFQSVWYVLDPQEKKMSNERTLEEETSQPEPAYNDYNVVIGGDDEPEKSFEDYDVKVDCDVEVEDEIGEDSVAHVFRVYDLTSEVERVYVYSEGDIQIKDPVTLYISEAGSHRVLSKDGWVSYIPPGWRLLQWLPRDKDTPVTF